MSIVCSRVCHNQYLSVYILLHLVLVLGLAMPSVCLVWYSTFVCMCVYVYTYLHVFFVCIHVCYCLCGCMYDNV